jgi:hypothetical protein
VSAASGDGRPTLRIDLYFWDGCPSHPEALARVEAALERAGAAARIELHEVESEEQAVALRFPGSPTILVEGRDVEPPQEGFVPSLGCRIFRAPGGRVGPVPSHETLDTAIQEALDDAGPRH